MNNSKNSIIKFFCNLARTNAHTFTGNNLNYVCRKYDLKFKYGYINNFLVGKLRSKVLDTVHPQDVMQLSRIVQEIVDHTEGC